LMKQPPPLCAGSSIQAEPDAGYRVGGPAMKRNHA